MDGTAVSRGLADAVLVLHAAIAMFVVGGLVCVLVGRARGWRWVDRLSFRLLHVAAIGIVVAESWFGIVCPLTTLEMWLRARAGTTVYGGGFVEHWGGRLLFFEAPPWVFVAAYSAFGAAVLATWWWFPPDGAAAAARDRDRQRRSTGRRPSTGCDPDLARTARSPEVASALNEDPRR